MDKKTKDTKQRKMKKITVRVFPGKDTVQQTTSDQNQI